MSYVLSLNELTKHSTAHERNYSKTSKKKIVGLLKSSFATHAIKISQIGGFYCLPFLKNRLSLQENLARQKLAKKMSKGECSIAAEICLAH